jgi:hypothetical protein
MSKPKNRRVKVVQIHAQSDLMGNLQRVSTGRNFQLELTAVGVLITSNKSQRVILVPFSNIQACELFPEDEEDESK